MLKRRVKKQKQKFSISLFKPTAKQFRIYVPRLRHEAPLLRPAIPTDTTPQHLIKHPVQLLDWNIWDKSIDDRNLFIANKAPIGWYIRFWRRCFRSLSTNHILYEVNEGLGSLDVTDDEDAGIRPLFVTLPGYVLQKARTAARYPYAAFQIHDWFFYQRFNPTHKWPQRFKRLRFKVKKELTRKQYRKYNFFFKRHWIWPTEDLQRVSQLLAPKFYYHKGRLRLNKHKKSPKVYPNTLSTQYSSIPPAQLGIRLPPSSFKNKYGLYVPVKNIRIKRVVVTSYKQLNFNIKATSTFIKPVLLRKSPGLKLKKVRNKRHFATNKQQQTPFGTSLADITEEAVQLLNETSDLYSIIKKAPPVVYKNHHLHDFGYEHYIAKKSKQYFKKRKVVICAPLLDLWGNLTKNSPYYQSGWSVSPLAIKKLKVLKRHNYYARVTYARLIVHSVDITKYNVIRFKPRRNIRRTKRKAGGLLISKLRYTTQIPLYFDPSFTTLPFKQPWITIYTRPHGVELKKYGRKKQRLVSKALLVVDPYTNNTYFINLRTIARVNFNVINLAAPALSTNPTSKGIYKLWYDIYKTDICFLKLVTSKDANWNRYLGEYFFKSANLPVVIARRPKVVVPKPPVKKRPLVFFSQYIKVLIKGSLNYKASSSIHKYKVLLLQAFNKRRAHLKNLLRYEYRTFKWKFFIKQWYYKYSSWKRAVIFKKILRINLNNYRRLSKEPLFIKLFKFQLLNILGINEQVLWTIWKKFRHGSRHNTSTKPVVKQFSHLLCLKLDNTLLLLGLASNRPVSQELVSCGGIRVNGRVIVNYNYTLALGDAIQIEFNLCQDFLIFNPTKSLNYIKHKVNFFPFFQPLWSIMLFKLIRWPYSHELVEESILTERWLRYYIRYFPIRLSKYKDV